MDNSNKLKLRLTNKKQEDIKVNPEKETEKDDLSVPFIDFFETTNDDLDKFNEAAWKKGEGYLAPNFPLFNQYLEGLDEGLYMFAGSSNTGKSACLLSIAWDLATNPDNKLYCLYFTLDDTINDLVPRLVAMNESIPISAVAKPQRYQNLIDLGDANFDIYQSYLDKRTEGIEHLKEQREHFKIIDGNTVQNAEQILDYCKKAQAYVKAIDRDNNILVCIDSLSDITFGSMSFKSDKELNDKIAKEVKKWSVEILKCPIFGSLHLRKIEQNRRPTTADVKESGRYVYEASVLFLVHNDVSINKQAASIYVLEEGSQEKTPVIELDWAKNKKSSFKGRTYHSFIPNFSKVTECNLETSTRFNHLIYGGS